MLTVQQIMTKLGCEEFDAEQVLEIQEVGLQHGKDGRAFEDDEDFELEIGHDIEHVSMQLLDETDARVRALYDAAVREGETLRKNGEKHDREIARAAKQAAKAARRSGESALRAGRKVLKQSRSAAEGTITP